MFLNNEQRTELLWVARSALELRLAGERVPVFDVGDAELLKPAGAFVTLHRKDKATAAASGRGGPLRGCIGTFEADTPLVEVVARMAVAAALSDPRFSPVALEELESLEIEISVLSARRPIEPDDVKVGVHGLYITCGASRGVLLPQVAAEYGWDPETFLDQTCRKAGLEAGSWRDDNTLVEAFTAHVFSEAQS